MRCVLILIFLLLSRVNHTYGQEKTKDGESQEFDQNFNKALSNVKGTYTGISSMAKGLGGMVGLVSKDYVYSYKVVNDTPWPAEVIQKKIISVMSGKFGGKESNEAIVLPFSSTGSMFLNQQLYFSISLFAPAGLSNASLFPATRDELKQVRSRTIATKDATKDPFYAQRITEWRRADPTVYTYRIFTKEGKLQGESLDVKGDTADFNGQFYNSTSTDYVMEYLYDTITYRIMLESQSFNMMQSRAHKGAIRPAIGQERGFQLYEANGSGLKPAAYIPIASSGLSIVTNKGSAEKADWQSEGSVLYAYKLYHASTGRQLLIDVQGITIGTFDQPVSTRVRDITPVHCAVWAQSAGQYEALLKAAAEKEKKTYIQQYASVAIDELQTLWVSYMSADYTIAKMVESGQVIDFSILRPRLSEKSAWLYMMALNTSDEVKARSFLKKVHSGSLGSKAFTAQASATRQEKPLIHGLIEDPVDGIKAIVLAADEFLPQGVGSGPFYYILYPPLLRVDQFAQGITFDDRWYIKDDSGKAQLQPTVLEELAKKLPRWIVEYPRAQNTVKKEFEDYYKQMVDKQFIKDGALNEVGRYFYDLLCEGPVSIKHYPLVRRAGRNYFVFGFGTKPEGWPVKD